MIYYAMLFFVGVCSQNIGEPPTVGSVVEAMVVLRKPATTALEYRHSRTIGHAGAMALLRSSPHVRPEELVDLLEIVLPDRNNPSVLYILELACERADDGGALRIIELMRSYGKEYFGLEPVSKPAKFVDTRAVDDTVMYAFVRKPARILAGPMRDSRPLMKLFYDWLMMQQQVGTHMRRASDIFMACITLPVPVEVRREYALKLLDNYRIMQTVPPEMAELIEDSMLPRLRSFIKRSVKDPDSFPPAAARLLADRGDLEVLPIMNQAETAMWGNEVLEGRKPEDIPGSCSWRIRIQHPPDSLLDWLAKGPSDSIEGRISQDTRRWIMERAVERGLEKEKIREATLQYARKYYKAGRPHNMELPSFKHRAIELGILRADDLPEIKLPPPARRQS